MTPPRARFNPHPYTEFPGVSAYVLERPETQRDADPDATGVMVRLTNSAPPALASRDARRADIIWSELAAANPRLYDGPLLAVVSIDFERGEFLCRRDSFRSLVVQPHVRTGVRLLAVTGVVCARDEAGRDHVLLGRRGEQTRIYSGMWELAPCGGVPPPHASIAELSVRDLRAHLREEATEEVGLTLDIGPVVGLLRDDVAHSDDLLLRCDAGPLAAAQARTSDANWEYSEIMWLPVDAVAQFDALEGCAIIAPTRAAFRTLGFIAYT